MLESSETTSNITMNEVVLENAFDEYRKHHSPNEIWELLKKLEKRIPHENVQRSRPPAEVPPLQSTNAPNTDGSAQQPTAEKAHLSNLHCLESNTHLKGYTILHIGSSYANVNGRKIFRGHVQQQEYKQKEGLLGLGMAEGSQTPLSDEGTPFLVPSFDEARGDYPKLELENVFEHQLQQYMKIDGPRQYLIATAHTEESRKQLGLPEVKLEAGPRLLCTHKHYPGIHSPYAYISASVSVFALHVEDFFLKSANLLHAGAPKLWVIIDPRYIHKLEGRLAEHMAVQPKCSQFLRHLEILPLPSLLQEWHIEFSVVLQQPGSLILIESSAYHYGVNLGPNLAEAINYSEPDWIVPPTYRECSKRNGCGDTKHMTVASMKMGDSRPLDVEDCEVMEVKPTQKERKPQNQPSYQRRSQAEDHGMVLRPRPGVCGKDAPTPKPTRNSLEKGGTRADIKRDMPVSDLELKPRGDAAQERTETEIKGPHDATLRAASDSKVDKELDSEIESLTKCEIENGLNTTEPELLHSEMKKVLNVETEKSTEEQFQEKRTPVIIKASDDKTGIAEASINATSNSETHITFDREMSQAADCKTQENFVSEVEEAPDAQMSSKAITVISEDDEDENREEPVNNDMTPRYKRGDRVGEIRWWIQFGVRNYRHFSWSGTAENVRHYLECFDPERHPVTETWLNDSVILLLLHHFKFEEKVQILDPLIIRDIVEKTESASSRINFDASTIIAPCHQGNHWCLVVVDVQKGQLDVYDTTDEVKHPIVPVLKGLLSTSHEWNVTVKPVSSYLALQINAY